MWFPLPTSRADSQGIPTPLLPYSPPTAAYIRENKGTKALHRKNSGRHEALRSYPQTPY